MWALKPNMTPWTWCVCIHELLCCHFFFFGLFLFFDMDTAESPGGSSDSRRESEQGVNADWVEVETVNVSSTEIQKSLIWFSTQMALNTGAHVQPAPHQSFITSCVFLSGLQSMSISRLFNSQLAPAMFFTLGAFQRRDRLLVVDGGGHVVFSNLK